jgi:glycosyltransferase involved in cell wall biosynthesis
MEKIKILRIVSSMNPSHGGVVESINTMAKSLVQFNIECHVLCFDNPDAEWIVKSAIILHPLGSSFTGYSINLKYLSWLKSNCSSYDLVIFDGLWQFLSNGWRIVSALNVPYFVFVHGMLDPYFNKSVFKYLKKIPFWFYVERLMLKNSNAVIFTSKLENELSLRSFPLFNPNAEICCLGVLKEDFYRHVLHFNDIHQSDKLIKGRRYGLFLSRINEKKGIDLLIKAISQSEIPEDFVIVIAGPDSFNYKSKLKSLANSLSVSQKIIWLDMVVGSEKWKLFYNSEFFILPSHQENFGIVVAEALLSSTPVLISNKVNICREVEVAQAGFVFDDSVEGVASAIKTWFLLPNEKILKLKENANSCFSKNFDQQHSAYNFSSIIKKYIN